MQPNPHHELIRRARYLRKNPTPAERLLWGRLRKRQVLSQKFRRQHVLAPYIVDFCCVPARLIVEVDGPVHAARTTDDETRDQELRQRHRMTVLRFTNHQVLEEIPLVIEAIESWLRDGL